MKLSKIWIYKKIQVECILVHFQGENYEFKIMVWNDKEKYSKNFRKRLRHETQFFFKVKEKHNIYQKSRFVLVENEKKKKYEEEGRKKKRKQREKEIAWRKGEILWTEGV